MGLTATGFVHQQEIKSAVQRVSSKFEPQVVRIRYSFGEDWIGAPSIFFRILVRDEDSRMDILRELAQRVAIALMNEAQTDENGLHAYFDYRTVSEQSKLQNPDWD